MVFLHCGWEIYCFCLLAGGHIVSASGGEGSEGILFLCTVVAKGVCVCVGG